MLDLCGVCRSKAADLISLKFKDESERILYKLKSFIPANVINYDPYLTSFICLRCFNDLEVAYKFKRKCEVLSAGHRQALMEIPKPSQFIGSASHKSKTNIKK